MRLNFHPPRWLVYTGIAVFALLITFFIISQTTTIIQTVTTKKQKEIEVLKVESDNKSDSLARVIVVEKKVSAQQVESLAKRAQSIKATAQIENKIILNRYEDLFKKVECYSDDSIGAIYRQYRDSAKFDTLLGN